MTVALVKFEAYLEPRVQVTSRKGVGYRVGDGVGCPVGAGGRRLVGAGVGLLVGCRVGAAVAGMQASTPAGWL